MALPVFIDANALMPISLADLLLRVTEEGLIEPFWSEHVLHAALAAAKRHRPDLDPAALDKRFAAMRQAFPDAMVDDASAEPDGYPSPDPEDQLVMAAADRSPADVIITRNLRDFPPATLRRYGLRAQTPDQLLLDLLESNPDQLLAAFDAMRAAMKSPPLTFDQMLENLGKAGVPEFAKAMAPRTRTAFNDALNPKS